VSKEEEFKSAWGIRVFTEPGYLRWALKEEWKFGMLSSRKEHWGQRGENEWHVWIELCILVGWIINPAPESL
jgi:hypothetical protein